MYEIEAEYLVELVRFGMGLVIVWGVIIAFVVRHVEGE